MKKLLLLAVLFSGAAFAATPCGPYADFSSLTASSNLAAALNGKLNVQCGTGSPVGVAAGTAQIDGYVDAVGNLYVATVSGNPATWVLIASPNVVLTTATYSNPNFITALAWGKISGVPTFLTPANNLSDLASAVTARTNLGLSAAAILPVFGSGSHLVAANALGSSGNCVMWAAAGLGDTGSPCGSSGGSGTVTSAGMTLPSWLAVAGSPITTTGTFAITPAAAQTSHQVIGTCGTATTFVPCFLGLGDLPTGYLYSNLSGGPTLPVGAVVGTTDTQTLSAKTVDGVTPATMAFLDATSSVQTQLNSKAAAYCPAGSTCNSIGLVTNGLLGYYDLSELTGTTVVDHSGNGNNGTFCSGGNAPTWSATAIVFAGNQCFTLPVGGLTGANTIMLWFRNELPPTVINQFASQVLLAADGTAKISFPSNRNGEPVIGAFSANNNVILDRFLGNTSIDATVNATAGVFGHDGHPIQGTLAEVNLPFTWAPASSIFVGSQAAGTEPWYGNLYAIAVWSGALSAPQKAASDNAVKTNLTAARGIHFESELDHTLPRVIFAGTSITAAQGTQNQLQQSMPWYAQQSASFPFDFYNIGIGSGLLANMTVADAATLRLSSNSVQNVYTLECCTNDIHNSTSGASIYAGLLSQCASIVALGLKCNLNTITPRWDNSGPQETQRQAANALLIAGFIARTATNVSWVVDTAGDPELGNPANFATSTANTITPDGVHFTDYSQSVWGQLNGMALDLTYAPGKEHRIVKRIPYNTTIVGSTAATTVTVPLLQLFPGESVCPGGGITVRPTVGGVGFSGGGISTITVSIGNSLGSTTAYTSAQSVFTGANPFSSAAAPVVPDNGVISAYFSANANLSGTTAGSIDIGICVTK